MANRDQAIWELAEWPITTETPVTHSHLEDLRRAYWMMGEGLNKSADYLNCSLVYGNTFQSHLPDWKDVLLPFPEADIEYEDAAENMQKAAWPNVTPGSYKCWYDYSFSYEVDSVDISYNSLGEFRLPLGSQITSPGLFNQTGMIIAIDGGEETWYAVQDDFRPGTPFEVNSTNLNWDQANNGFYRVKSTRIDGSYLCVLATDLDGNDRQLSACSGFNGVDAACDFGGDWWVFVGNDGSSSITYADPYDGGVLLTIIEDLCIHYYIDTASGLWWSQKDKYHRYPPNPDGTPLRGPNDGRPPTGGQWAANGNGNWVRFYNPVIYHCGDNSQPRFHVDGSFEGNLLYAQFGQYACMFPASDLLPHHVDAKGKQPPKYYLGDSSTKYKYGSKVALLAEHITDPATLGPVQNFIETGYSMSANDADHHGRGWTDNYIQAHPVEVGNYGSQAQAGLYPIDHYAVNWADIFQQKKCSKSIQNAIEGLCQGLNGPYGAGGSGWALPPDDDYKTNWFWKHYNDALDADYKGALVAKGIITSSVSTYGQAYDSAGLSAWQPALLGAHKQFADLTDEYWGECGHALGVILKMLGPDYYDWYFDTDYIWLPQLAVNERWEYKQYSGTYDLPYTTVNGITGINTWEEYAEAAYPAPVGVWRRVPKYTLGCREQYNILTDNTEEPMGMHSYWFDFGDLRAVGRVVFDSSFTRNINADDMYIPDLSDFAETSYSSYTALGDNKYSFAGDITDQVKAGHKLWTNSGTDYYFTASPSVYNVISAHYDTVAELTYILFDAAPTGTLYHNYNISERHFADTGQPGYVSRIGTILNQLRDVLQLLNFAKGEMTHHNMAGVGVSSYGYSGYPDVYYFQPGLTETSSLGEVKAQQAGQLQYYYDQQNPNDTDDWTGQETVSIGQGWQFHLGWHYNDQNDPWVGGISINRGGLVVDTQSYIETAGYDPFNAPGTTWVMLKIESINGAGGRSAVDYDYDNGIFSNIHQIVHDPGLYTPDGNYYGTEYIYEHCEGTNSLEVIIPPAYVFVPLTSANVSGSIEFGGQECSLIEFSAPWGDVMTPGPPSDSFINSNYNVDRTAYFCGWGVQVSVVNQYIYSEVDWPIFSNVIWDRLITQSELVYGDLGDTDPPVPSPVFVRGPFLYDANLVHRGGGGSDYENDNYTADWRIIAYVNLVEDEAGHGVLYNFEAHAEIEFAGQITHLAALYSANDDYEYDIALPDNEYGWTTKDYNDVEPFYLTVQAHDNFSSFVGQDDNYCPDIAISDELSLHPDTPFFPHKPIITVSRVQESAAYYDTVNISVPWWNDDSIVGYQIEVANAEGLSIIVDETTPQYVRTVINPTTVYKYRVRYIDNKRHIPGQWSAQVVKDQAD